MNNAIIFIKQQDFATTQILGKTILEYTYDRLKKAGVDHIYLIGANAPIQKMMKDKAECIVNTKETFLNLSKEAGKTLLVSLYYPNLKLTTYTELLSSNQAKAVLINGERSEIFVLANQDLIHFNQVKYEIYDLKDEAVMRVENTVDAYQLLKSLQKEINQKHLENGVMLYDLGQTYIGEDVVLEKGVTIYPDCHLEGKTKISKGTVITNGSHLINATVGEDCSVLQSRIVDSVVHNRVTLGPCSHLRMNCEVYDDVRIGNYVEFKNTKFGRLSRAAHLTYLGDSTVGEDVNIGCGVVTVNYDGAHKFKTVIKDRAFVGSNANLIAPITVGECSLVAAGSTVSQDVADGDMAIARSYQIIKPGYGEKYINKEK